MWSGDRTVIRLKDEDVLQGNADTCAILVQMGKGGPSPGRTLDAQCDVNLPSNCKDLDRAKTQSASTSPLPVRNCC